MGYNHIEFNPLAPLPAATADATLAAAALRVLCPTGPVNIVWIDPASGAVGGVTRPTVDEVVAAAIADRIDTHNLYFTVNEPHPTAPSGKLRKSDIVFVHAVFADLDPRPGADPIAERERLHDVVNTELASEFPPAAVIDSGNGLQIIWRTAPTTDFARAEALGRGVAKQLGSDPVQNVDRILRIPYTNNIPTARKQALGRVTRPTGILFLAAEPVAHELPALERRFPPVAHSPSTAVAHNPVDWAAAAEPIEPSLAARFAAVADSDAVLRAIIAGVHQHAGDKSRMDFALIGRLHDHGFEPQEIATAAMHFKHGKTPELLHDDPSEAQRQFDRALARAPHTIPAAAEFEPIPGFDPGRPPPAVNDNVAQSVFDTTARPPLAYERFDEIRLPRGRNYLIKGLLDRDAMSVIYGASGVGKTHVTLDLAFHVATGAAWRNSPTEPGLVIYVAAEGGNSLRKRVLALRRKYAEQIAAQGRVPIAVVTSPVNLLDPAADVQPLIELARRAAADFGCPPAWIIVDTLSRAMAGGNENSSEDMGALVMNADAIRAAFRCHFSFVHHSGKDAAKGARGHSLLRAATDTELEVEEGKISATKQRDMELGPPHEWAIETVEIGTDEEGAVMTSAIAVEKPAGAEFSPEVEAAVARAEDHEAAALAAALDQVLGPDDKMPWAVAKGAVQTAYAHYQGKETVGLRTVEGAVLRLFRSGRVVRVGGRSAEYSLRKRFANVATSPLLVVRRYLDFVD